MKQDYYLGLSEEGFHKVAYLEWGTPTHTQPPIICVHGLTRNSHDFDALAAYLTKQDRHVFCPDIVGRGDSDWMKNPLHYTFEQYLADMNAMITRTGAHQVDWIGTSLGGLLGMILAAQPNSPIRHLVLNDIGPQIPTKGLMRIASLAGKEPDFSSIEEALSYYKKAMTDAGNLTDDEWLTITKNSIREVSPGKFIAKTDHGVKFSQAKSKLAWKAMMHPFKAFEGSLFDIDLWHVWRNVKCPVLVIHGKKSDILMPSIINKMRTIHPDIDVMEIADAGHAPALLRAEQHETICQWLKK